MIWRVEVVVYFVLVVGLLCHCFANVVDLKGNKSHIPSTSSKSMHDFYKSKQHLEATAGKPVHLKTWHDLMEVNGLKNQEVIVFVTSSTAHDQRLLWERVIPSARTWMKLFANVYTVIEDNVMIRYALRHCKHRDFKHYTTFKCSNEPNYLLTRTCTDEYYNAAGICCKVDALFDFLINENKDLFQTTKYVLIGDDDTYFRPDQIMKWLSAVDNSGISHFPIVGNPNPTKEDHGIWHINNCKEIRATGWYQPMMINHAAMKKMAIASAAYGLTDICKNFVLSQDVGLETYVWLFGVYHILIPNVAVNGEHYGSKVFKPNQLIVHAIRNTERDNCGKGHESKWPEEQRYDQRLAVGCGDVDHPGPFHNATETANMYDAWEYYLQHGEEVEFGKEGEYEFEKTLVTIYPQTPEQTKVRVKEILPKGSTIQKGGRHNGDEVVELVLPRLQFIDGYSKTKHAQTYDIVNKEWHAFGMKDCDPPATFQ